MMKVEICLWPNPTKEGIVMPDQTHSAQVIEVVTGQEQLPDCDALITQNRALILGVRTADCAPIALSDGKRIAIIHAGWRGLCNGIIDNVLSQLKEPKEVYVGPHLHAFEIQRDFCYDAITEKFGDQFLESQGAGYLFHFKDAIASLLPATTRFDDRNTGTDSSLPSHRNKRRHVTMITSVRL